MRVIFKKKCNYHYYYYGFPQMMDYHIINVYYGWLYGDFHKWGIPDSWMVSFMGISMDDMGAEDAFSWRRPENLLGQLTHSCSAYRCYIYMYIYICIYIYMYMYICIHIYIYVIPAYHCSLRTTMDYSTIFYQYFKNYYFVLYNYVQYLIS